MLKFMAAILTVIFLPLMLIQVIIGAVIYLLGVAFNFKSWKMFGKNLALAADQNMNVVWLGDPDETISSRCGRAEKSGRPKWYIKHLLRPFVDWAARRFGDGPNHCINSIEESELYKDEVWKWHHEE